MWKPGQNIKITENDVAEAVAGQRVALNLSGLKERSTAAAWFGYYRMTSWSMQ